MSEDTPTTRNMFNRAEGERRLNERYTKERMDRIESTIDDLRLSHGELRGDVRDVRREVSDIKGQLLRNTELLEPIRAMLTLRRLIIGFSALVAAIAGLITVLRVWVPT